MKHVVIFLITLYQLLITPFLRSIFGSKLCRYDVSCSMYAKQQISKHGIIRGGKQSVKRLLSCSQFFH